MASQWTIQKLVTWRVKDWATCFLASKIPIGLSLYLIITISDVDEDNNTGNTMNNNNVMFKRTKRKMKSKKKRSERKLSLSPPGTRHNHLRSSSVSPTSASQNRRLSWQQQQQPRASDEPGFIVFCFDREDGEFDVVKEGKEERKEVELSLEKSPRTVNRKLIYGDQGEGKTEKNNSLEIKETGHDQDDKTTCQQETKDVSCDDHDQKNEEEEEEVDASDKSSGSSHSDERRGSFAFPILGVEWMGSPVQMPKTDDLSPKKQGPIALGFQCCRF
ncbi:hypothetical protein N665_0502s0048 [Sinapis alba]|nr:hypothetical protein N665_0502s0048 [Sinapis alba]